MNDGHSSHPEFVRYYVEASLTEKARQRAASILAAVMRERASRGASVERLAVADIGCNAGTQSRVWLEAGHLVEGLDISSDLVEVASRRNSEFAGRARFQVGNATRLPWSDAKFDVCLMPELLEHVLDLEAALREAVRVLKLGGTLFLTTTNWLCPVQQEFNLPGYSWYPGWLKKIFLKKALSTSPQLANYATHPAYHWFSYYQLRRYLVRLSITARDRFDVADMTNRPPVVVAALRLIRALPPLRLAAHVLTEGTIVVGEKRPQ